MKAKIILSSLLTIVTVALIVVTAALINTNNSKKEEQIISIDDFSQFTDDLHSTVKWHPPFYTAFVSHSYPMSGAFFSSKTSFGRHMFTEKGDDKIYVNEPNLPPATDDKYINARYVYQAGRNEQGLEAYVTVTTGWTPNYIGNDMYFFNDNYFALQMYAYDETKQDLVKLVWEDRLFKLDLYGFTMEDTEEANFMRQVIKMPSGGALYSYKNLIISLNVVVVPKSFSEEDIAQARQCEETITFETEASLIRYLKSLDSAAS